MQHDGRSVRPFRPLSGQPDLIDHQIQPFVHQSNNTLSNMIFLNELTQSCQTLSNPGSHVRSPDRQDLDAGGGKGGEEEEVEEEEVHALVKVMSL